MVQFNISLTLKSKHRLYMHCCCVCFVTDNSVDANVEPPIGLSVNISCSFSLVGDRCIWEQEEPECVSNMSL